MSQWLSFGGGVRARHSAASLDAEAEVLRERPTINQIIQKKKKLQNSLLEISPVGIKVQSNYTVRNTSLQIAREVTQHCSSVVTFNKANLVQHGGLMENTFFFKRLWNEPLLLASVEDTAAVGLNDTSVHALLRTSEPLWWCFCGQCWRSRTAFNAGFRLKLLPRSRGNKNGPISLRLTSSISEKSGSK